MLARAQLSVIALAALAACAAARPDYIAGKNSYTTKNYVPTNSPNLNTFGPLHDTANLVSITATTAAFLDEAVRHEAKTSPSVKPTPVEGVATFDEDKILSIPLKKEVHQSVFETPDQEYKSVPSDIPLLFRNDSKPVNLRYPHAVLFGGTCGGSIIHPKWILTAGHCTLFTGGRYVLAGTNNSDDGSGVTKKVKKLHIHPKFSVGPYWLNAENYGIKQVAARWDFLLAELEEPLELDGVKIAAVSLMDEKKLPSNMYVGYAGYGTDHHGGFMRSEMHAMNLITQPESTCKTLEQYNGRDMICAKGYEPNYDSACNGDSGSGLVTGSGKLLGVASWVQNDALECKNGNIVVFSKVASARDWIRQVAGL